MISDDMVFIKNETLEAVWQIAYNTPVISGPSSDVRPSSSFTCTPLSAEGTSVKHDQTEWKLVQGSVVKTYTSTGNTCPKLDLAEGQSYTLSCRQHDSIQNAWSEWSEPFAFKCADKFVTVLPSKRSIYRHENNQGSVLEFDMYGRKTRMFVPDAKYRTKATWGTYGKDHGMTKYDGDLRYINPKNTFEDQKQPLPYTLTDAQLQSQFPSFSKCKTETAKFNTDKLMQHSDTNAAHECRKVSVGNLGPMDLPNIYELMVLYLESDAIDNLDPTVSANPTKALGMKGADGRFYNDTGYMWSSCEYSSGFSRNVNSNGNVNNFISNYKHDTNGVCPVKEL